MQGTKRIIKPGERVNVIGSYSEVMCHFGLAGKPCQVELIRREYDGGATVYYSGQMYVDGRPFSGTITYGEAGIYCEDYDAGIFYVYEAAPDDKGDDDPAKLLADSRGMLEAAIAASGADVLVITNLGL